jgi:chromosomal replication initiation ATPase DnaA
LELPHRAAYGREDFLVSGSNARAVSLIDSWPNWPSAAALLIGPAGSGKTHLVEVWRRMSGARAVSGLGGTDAADLLSGGALAVENLPGGDLNETGLFHLLNLARELRAHVLFTAREHPISWGVRLPDLASRLQALPVAAIGDADDALLRGVLLKLFADRQIAVDEPVLTYLISRIPRSLATARLVVAEIDRHALEQGAAVGRSFVARVLPQILGDAQRDLFIE